MSDILTYEVKAGDTLAKIALRELGDAMRWPEIYQANKAAMDRAYARAEPELRRIKASAIRHPSDYLSARQKIIIPSALSKATTDPTANRRSK